MGTYLCAVVPLLFASALASFAQTALTATTQATPPPRFTGRATFSVPRFAMPAVVGAPFSADEVNEGVQTLADGTHITQPSRTSRLCRDSQGRTRTERPMFGGPHPAPEISIVEITDPVAGIQLVLDTYNRVAHRAVLPASAPPPRQSAPAAMPRPPQAPDVRNAFGRTTSESLGTQMIEGVLAEGHRNTRVIPAGEQGNDRPLTSVNENWFSPDLQRVVLSKNTDPRSGEHTTRLVNIVRAEPDPALFQVPPDYTVVEEKGPSFTIEITRP